MFRAGSWSVYSTNEAWKIACATKSKAQATRRVARSWADLRRKTCLNTLFFSRCSITSRILTGIHQQSYSHLFGCHVDLIIDLDSQAFSRRFTWHSQVCPTSEPAVGLTFTRVREGPLM